MRTFYLLFRWLYPFDSLRLRDKKKNLQPKRKNLFDLRFFYLSRGKEKEKREKLREEEQRKSNTPTGQIVIYLVGALLERKSIAFYKQGKSTPLLQKVIQEIEKRKEKHNTQKIYSNLGKIKI